MKDILWILKWILIAFQDIISCKQIICVKSKQNLHNNTWDCEIYEEDSTHFILSSSQED